MKETYGEMEIDEAQLKAADPDRLYLFMLEQYPYMMTPGNVAAFTGTTGQEIRKLLKVTLRQRGGSAGDSSVCLRKS